ncbi:hypothetical protein FHT04_002763 [Xanthomonas campestris]|nr:hypothetical protein [Xanthomonas cannabis]
MPMPMPMPMPHVLQVQRLRVRYQRLGGCPHRIAHKPRALIRC